MTRQLAFALVLQLWSPRPGAVRLTTSVPGAPRLHLFSAARRVPHRGTTRLVAGDFVRKELISPLFATEALETIDDSFPDVPAPTRLELVRLELKEVPADAARLWLRSWAGRRVPDRPDTTAAGVPRTNMPVSATVKDGSGIVLSFDATPTDTIDLTVYPLARGASCILATAGENGSARRGLLGPQVQSLVTESQQKIWQKLKSDAIGFAREYHHSAAGRNTRREQRPADVGHKSTFPAKGDGAESPLRYPEPQQRQGGAAGTAFPGGTFADPTEELPRDDDFKRFAFEMFESVRNGGASFKDGGVKGFEGVLEGIKAANRSESQLALMFKEGQSAARRSGVNKLVTPLDNDLVQLGLVLDGTELQGGLDIFAGPPRAIGTEYTAFATANGESVALTAAGPAEKPEKYVLFDEDGEALLELTADEAASVDEDELEVEMIRLDVLIAELLRAPSERFISIASNYREVLLSDYYLLAMRARVARMRSERERSVLVRINEYTTTLVQEVAMMGQALEMQQLEKIRTICQSAVENMARLPDHVRGMRPLLDKDFLAYLQYAISVEKGRIRSRGMDPAREPTTWLQVLGVIQQGVVAELAKDVYLDVQAISYVLRMPSLPERRALLDLTIARLPSMDVRAFKKAADNIVANMAVRADVDEELRVAVAEFGLMVQEILPPERVVQLSAEADESARQRIEGVQNPTGELPDLISKYGLTEDGDEDDGTGNGAAEAEGRWDDSSPEEELGW